MTRRQRRILKWVRLYQQFMGLDRWQIVVDFKEDEQHEQAACNADDEYMRAMLSFNLRYPEAEDETNVRHELLHCMTWELLRSAEHIAKRDRNAVEMVRAANERCITMLERMPIWKTSGRTT